MTNAGRIRIDCEAFYNADTGTWVGVCKPLNIIIDESSLDELHKSFGEAMNLLFADLKSSGDLDEFLLEKGWTSADLESEDGQPQIPWAVIAWEKGHHGTQKRPV